MKKKLYDFSLSKKEQDDYHHSFITIADPQIFAQKEFVYLEEAAADIQNTIQSHNNKIPFHGICCGDIISNDHTFIPLITG